MTDDAVIVLPGLMGSELVDTESGRTVWGRSDPRWYVRAWTDGPALDALRVTEDERAGRAGRITPTRLLRFPAFAPGLRGVEPYSDLTARLRLATHPDAVLGFPYDWRLSIEHNARRLAVTAERHLAQWRARAGGPDARLILVAHSAGGLVARYFTEVLGGAAIVRAVVSLGTPFSGAVRVLSVIGDGAGLPTPQARVRALLSTMPGVHDLLPAYHCVDEGETVRRLTIGDIENIGGDGELASEAFARREKVTAAAGVADFWPLVGVHQDTPQSVVFVNGVALEREYTCDTDEYGKVRRVDRKGDGTVVPAAATPSETRPWRIPQTHGALAARVEGITHASAAATHTERVPTAANESGVGLRVSDTVTAGTDFRIEIAGAATPDGVECLISEAATKRAIAKVHPVRKDGLLVGSAWLRTEGLYRIEVKAGARSAVTEIVMVSRG
ncbi:hypothetical protein [Nocardia sp. NPDC050710]|uniref:esterase/lipase family protein n=1 Tax=Nocardia sp. NPDC050710 TaxID=3157220 RepID=UPI0033CBFB1A